MNLNISSREYWFKVTGFLGQNYAVVEPGADGVVIYFFYLNGKLFDEIDQADMAEAEQNLRYNRFCKFSDDPEHSKYIECPTGTFRREADWNEPIYSSGRYWRTAPISRSQNENYDRSEVPFDPYAVRIVGREWWVSAQSFVSQEWALIEPNASGVQIHRIDMYGQYIGRSQVENWLGAKLHLMTNGFSPYRELRKIQYLREPPEEYRGEGSGFRRLPRLSSAAILDAGLQAYATMWNKRDTGYFRDFIHDNFTYEARPPVKIGSRSEYLIHMDKMFSSFKAFEQATFAQIGIIANRPRVIVSFDDRYKISRIVSGRVIKGKLSQLISEIGDGQMPITRSGVFPGLD